MRQIILTTIVLLLASWAQAATNTDQQEQAIRTADSLYRAADYEGAAEVYEAILSSGYTNAALHYNLANAYYRLDLYGPAILNYERALRLDPGMSDARQNLALTKSKTIDRIASLPSFFLTDWYNTLTTHISASVWRILIFILLALACAATAILILSGRIALRKGALATLIVSCLLLAFAVWMMLSTMARANNHNEVIVMEPSMAVKSSPEYQSTDKLILHEGTKATIAETLPGWYKLALSDGTSGWCENAAVEKI